MPFTTFRVARPTNDLAEIRRFYADGLGLQILGHFEDHEGFDGVMLGRPGDPFHLEFTREHDHPAPRAPTEENLLVFYYPQRPEWEAAAARMRSLGYAPVRARNPYWERNGLTFEDFEGYRTVLYCGTWP
jgi:catechol 2,3-dioxygenase-like lactoylglutathione lyase family enzyme